MSKIAVSDSRTAADRTIKHLNKNLLLYELRNMIGDPFVYIFGVILPIFLSFIISKAAVSEVPENALSEAVTSISISMSIMIPMATILIGHTAIYSKEMEKGIPLRMSLFGYEEKTLFLAKAVAELIYMTAAFLIYAVMEIILLDIQIPAVSSVIYLILCLYLIAAIFFMLSTGIVNFVKKFGPSYAVSMSLYFLFMVLCGMMGIKTEELPKVLKIISKLVPMSYISNDFGGFWKGGSYNFVPMIQSYLFLGAVSGILCYLSVYKNKRA